MSMLEFPSFAASGARPALRRKADRRGTALGPESAGGKTAKES